MVEYCFLQQIMIMLGRQKSIGLLLFNLNRLENFKSEDFFSFLTKT
jgi:hypothetical protein